MNFTRKRDQVDHLKRLLTQLTDEMRQKYSQEESEGKIVEEISTEGNFNKPEILRESNFGEKLRKLSESQGMLIFLGFGLL